VKGNTPGSDENSWRQAAEPDLPADVRERGRDEGRLAKFVGDPDWQRLRGMDEYSDRNILAGITNLVLKPAEYSQI
jgi:hypothetical protein